MAKGARMIDIIETGPTTRQRERFGYEEHAVREGINLKGRVYRRVPLIVRLQRSELIGDREAQALLWYRDRHDEAQYSPVPDSLAVGQPRGGTGDYEKWRGRVLDAQADVTYAEAGVAEWLRPTLRAMALDDMGASDVARWRWWCEGAVPTKLINRVNREFTLAASQMLTQVGHMMDAKRA